MWMFLFLFHVNVLSVALNHNKELIIIFFFTCRHLLGDAISSLSVKELKQLENKLERGITRIRSKKVIIKEIVKWKEVNKMLTCIL